MTQSFSQITLDPHGLARRQMMRGAGIATLSAAAVTLLGGCAQRAVASSAMESDAEILNIALGLEYEAIAAYQLGAESGLLQKPVLDVAVLFQGHHKGHRDALAATVSKLGGMPVQEKALGAYAEMLDAGSLKSQADVLALAIKLEKGANAAYLGVIPKFEDGELARIAGRIASDEAMHWTALTSAVGGALPGSALTFGA
jgi:hypothetical protein